MGGSKTIPIILLYPIERTKKKRERQQCLALSPCPETNPVPIKDSDSLSSSLRLPE